MVSSWPTIVLYDISSRLNPQAWGFTTWKVRLVLNYKRIPYKTTWISYPDIKPTLESMGVKATDRGPDGELLYTLPAIVDTSNGSPIVITDGPTITEYLEDKFPDPPIFSKQGRALDYAFEATFFDAIVPHVPKLVLPSVLDLLDDRSKPYFRETRERWFGEGKKLEEWCPEGPTREALWKALENALDEIAKILDKNGPGVDYVAGESHPTRADLVLVAFFTWINIVLPEDWEKRVRHWSGGRWERLWKITEDLRVVY